MKSETSLGGIVTFADGIPGFEGTRQFVLVASPSMEPFTLVQGIEQDAPSFLTIDPSKVAPGYEPELANADRLRLAAGPADPLVWLALVTAREDGSATVNLRAPLIINPESMRGVQLLPSESPYPLDYPFQAA